jgi:hypothetical protein
MNVGRLKLLLTDETGIWRRITNARKSPLKQAALIGFDTLFLLATRQLTLAGAESRIMKRLNITGRAIVCPYAEVGMDVDKPFQLEIMRRDLKKRLKKAAAAPKKSPVHSKKVPARKPVVKKAVKPKAPAKKTSKK